MNPPVLLRVLQPGYAENRHFFVAGMMGNFISVAEYLRHFRGIGILLLLLFLLLLFLLFHSFIIPLSYVGK